MKKIAPLQFEVLQRELQQMLGSYWTLAVVKKDDAHNYFDPPCRYLLAHVKGLVLAVCESGEIYVDEEVDEVELGPGWLERIKESILEMLSDGQVPN